LSELQAFINYLSSLNVTFSITYIQQSWSSDNDTLLLMNMTIFFKENVAVVNGYCCYI